MPDANKTIGYITITKLAIVMRKDPRTLAAWARAGDVECDVRRSRVHMRGVRYHVRVYGDGCARVCGAHVEIPSGLYARERAA